MPVAPWRRDAVPGCTRGGSIAACFRRGYLGLYLPNVQVVRAMSKLLYLPGHDARSAIAQGARIMLAVLTDHWGVATGYEAGA